MICPKCTFDVIDGAIFCPQCGQRLAEGNTSIDSHVDEIIDVSSEIPKEVEDDPDAEMISEQIGTVEDAGSSLATPFVMETTDVPLISPVTPAAIISQPDIPEVVQAEQTTGSVVIVPPIVSAKVQTREQTTTVAPISAAEKKQVLPNEVSAVTESVPKALRPITTAGTFWYFLLISFPCIGLIVLICLAAGSKNQSRRSLARAILLWRLVFLLALCLVFTVLFFVNRSFLVEVFDLQNWYTTAEFLLNTFLHY